MNLNYLYINKDTCIWNISSPGQYSKVRSGKTKDYEICTRCFSAKHTALRKKNKEWLARNQDNVSE
jgi:hypothetical protein